MNDLIIIDPCYIKSIKDSTGATRFDGLRCVKVLHDGDDGIYNVYYLNPDKTRMDFGCVGVDSGRIWVMQAEFGKLEIETQSGYLGEQVIRVHDAWDKKQINRIKCNY